MPLYEYECDACGHRFEVIQKFSDAPIEKCPSCGGPVHKLQSAPAFQFRGTGFYATDYAKKDEGKTAKPEAASTEDGKGKTEKSDKGEKPAATSEKPAGSGAKETSKTTTAKEP